MDENQTFQPGLRGCLISVIHIILALAAMAVSTNFPYSQPVACRGMLGAGFPLPFICDDWGGGSPTGSWGKIDLIDIVNGGIRPTGFFVDLLFFILLILIIWSAVPIFRQNKTHYRGLWWTTFILAGFLCGFTLAFAILWSSDLYIKNPPIGTPTPVIPSPTSAMPSVTPNLTSTP